MKIDLLQDQLRLHRSSLEENLRGIDYDLCDCTNAIYRLPYGAIGDYNRIHLRYKAKLYQEVRKHRSEYLKMTTMLRKEMLDTQLEMQNLEEKLRFLQ